MQETHIEQTAATGAELLARGLTELGITRVFGLCGDQVNAIFSALSHEGIEIIGTRHETAAVHMADAWARATGEVGVDVVTGGPGHSNGVTGLAVAFGASSPVIVISGQAPIDKRDRGGTQVMHQADIVTSVTKFSREVTDAKLVPEMLYRAYLHATSPTPGPVSLSIPVDVFNARISGYEASFKSYPRSTNFARVESLGYDLSEALPLLEAAKRPVVILGSGAHWADDPHILRESLTALGFPVFTSELARGLLPDDGNLCFGYADPRFSRAFRLVEEADLILFIGASFDFHTLFGRAPLFRPDAKVIQVIDDPLKASLCRPSDVVLCGSISTLSQHLVQAVGAQAERTDWLNSLKDAYRKNQDEWEDLSSEAASDPSIHPIDICRSISRHMTDSTGFIFDVGDFVHWPRLFFPARARGHFMDGSIMGTLGAALPQAIGMQLAFPDDPIIAFMGDGGFAQASWELSTAVERNLPIKLVIGNDAAWGVELRLQENEFGQAVECLLPEHRLERFAEMVGAKAIFVDEPAQLDAAVDEMMVSKKACLLNIRIPRRCGRPLSDIAIPM